jgi:hypothetical protein
VVVLLGWDLLSSCVLHSVHLVKAFAPAMIALGRGRVIGINTECAMQCFETQAAYASAKRWTGCSGAREARPRNLVNQVAPVDNRRPNTGDTGARAGSQEYGASVRFERRENDPAIAGKRRLSFWPWHSSSPAPSSRVRDNNSANAGGQCSANPGWGVGP